MLAANNAAVMFTLFCPVLAMLAVSLEEQREHERFRRMRLDVREKYWRDVRRGRITHVQDDIQ
jgi:hypothetical protein